MEPNNQIVVATDVVVLTTERIEPTNNRHSLARELKVLLAKRLTEPQAGKWALPGGKVEPEKGLEETVQTKLAHKAGIKANYIEQLYTYGDDVHRDPRGRTISVAYLMLTNGTNLYTGAPHSEETAWFWVAPIHNVDGTARSVILSRENDNGDREIINELAFDHMNIIVDAYNRIRNKLEYTDIIFHAIEEEFTIAELQHIYERFKGKDISGFRKKLGDMVVGTDHYTKGAHRPAQLFRYNPNHSDRF